MAEYRVNLDIYNVPLDLLLYLIRRDELDIHDIPIARITEQYLQYVELIKQLDIDLAGQFLVMAATLMEIKSAMLLPCEEFDEQHPDELADPRLELVRQLLEYKKYKQLAGQLAQSAARRAARFGRPLADLQRLLGQQRQEETEIESVQIWDLLEAFNRLMQATLTGQTGQEVIQDDTPIDLYETDILDRAQREKPLTFEAVFRGRRNRTEIVALFLALLELIRQKLVRIEQEKAFGPIYIFALTEEPAQNAVDRAVSAEIDRLPSHIQKEKKQQSNSQKTFT